MAERRLEQRNPREAKSSHFLLFVGRRIRKLRVQQTVVSVANARRNKILWKGITGGVRKGCVCWGRHSW